MRCVTASQAKAFLSNANNYYNTLSPIKKKEYINSIITTLTPMEIIECHEISKRRDETETDILVAALLIYGGNRNGLH